MANALVPKRSQEVAFPVDLVDAAKRYATASMAPNTRAMYAHWWKDYSVWCETVAADPLPVTVQNVILYVTWLAGGRGGRHKPMARSSIEQALAAIKRAARGSGEPLDDKNPALQEVLKGIRREIAKSRTVRKVAPLMSTDIRDLLQFFDPLIPREARNRALIALGFAGCLRRSEIVGLDWGKAGTKKDEARIGYVTSDATGLTITLLTSKNYQDEALTKVIPRTDAPLTCEAVENWAAVRGIKPGEPLFPGALVGSGFETTLYAGCSWRSKEKVWRAQMRRTDVKGKAYKSLGDFKTIEEAAAAIVAAGGRKEVRTAAERLPGGYVPWIIKAAVRRLLEQRTGRKRIPAAEIQRVVAQYSGHSMRAGHITDAFERGVPQHHIKQQSGHKTDSQLMGYARAVSKVKNNSLRGSGL
jgi:integrase